MKLDMRAVLAQFGERIGDDPFIQSREQLISGRGGQEFAGFHDCARVVQQAGGHVDGVAEVVARDLHRLAQRDADLQLEAGLRTLSGILNATEEDFDSTE